jgi:ribosomal protein S18 acetylase RimI-like enzyme
MTEIQIDYSNMLKIDTLKPEYLVGLKELYEESFEGSVTDLGLMKQTYNLIKGNSNYIILCALTDAKVVGSVMGVVCYELFGECHPFMVVENVAVLEAYRGKGIARELMTNLEKYALDNKCTTILLVSSVHRTGAHKLYESLGYGNDKVNGYRKRLA